MTMTDPIADMLTRIRNANVAMHDSVTMPSSKSKVALADVLESEGYIHGYEVRQNEGRPGSTMTIISGLRRVSKPGLRVYSKADLVPRVLGGLGVAVVSTSNGLMSDRDARRKGVGGEILCEVW